MKLEQRLPATTAPRGQRIPCCGHYLRHRRQRHMLYRCRACKHMVCGWHNGTDDQDFHYCDGCAAVRRRRRERRAV